MDDSTVQCHTTAIREDGRGSDRSMTIRYGNVRVPPLRSSLRPSRNKNQKNNTGSPSCSLSVSLFSLSLFSSPSTSSLPLLFSPYNPHTQLSSSSLRFSSPFVPLQRSSLLQILFPILFNAFGYLRRPRLLYSGIHIGLSLTSSSLDIYFFFFFIFFQYVDLLLPATTSAAAPSPRPCRPHAVE